MKEIEIALTLLVLASGVVWLACRYKSKLYKIDPIVGGPPWQINPYRVLDAWSMTVLLLCSGANLFWFGSLLLASYSQWFAVPQLFLGATSAWDAWVLTQKYRSWRAMKALGAI